MAKTKKDEIREIAEADLEAFIRLVHPNRVLGSVHREVIQWWTRDDAKSHQLTLLPRDHQKSALMAYWVAWMITRNPAIRILYISSTSNLASKQLKFIKDILTSKIYSVYWPDMVNPDEGRREKWTESEISVDHPLRKAENVRDPTIFIAGLTTGITGMHSDINVLDDVVVKENAYTEEGRDRVAGQFSLLASIEGTQGIQKVVGTRYHPKDLYATMQGIRYEIIENGEVVGDEALYETFERAVEDRGDGTGEFLWPLQQRKDGKWFGFNAAILAKKRALYVDKTQFRAQYYNDPNDPDGGGIPREAFQYYEPKYLTRQNGAWFYKNNRLNVYASIDFAYSLSREADYTCIAVVGIDANQNYYVLELDRFKTKSVHEYFQHILVLHQKWDFRTLRAEATAAQAVIVDSLKINYIRTHGIALAINDYKPDRREGAKSERVKNILAPRYDNRQIFHYMGGSCQILEEELLLDNPPHDDCKDALASCIAVCVAPTFHRPNSEGQYELKNHSRFGGIY